MLAFAVTLFIALYILGPDQLSRFILDFSVPRRAVTLTRSEEVARAAIWSGIAFLLAWLWAHWFGSLKALYAAGGLEIFLSGLFNEAYFHEHREIWFQNAKAIFWFNWALLWRIYFLVVLVSLLFNQVIRRYGRVRHACRNQRVLAWVLSNMVLPRVAPWHVLLSDLLIDQHSVTIYIDVLTKSDILYQGVLADKVLAQDGSLVTVVLDRPRRFRREAYTEAVGAGLRPNSDDYWREIPTKFFVLLASDIHSLNIRHVPQDVGVLKRIGGKDMEMLLKSLSQAVQSARKLEGGQGPLTS